MSSSAYECNITYLSLAIMLNSLSDKSKNSLLGFDNTVWLNLSDNSEQMFGWPELFFAAGLLLTREGNVNWQKMASAIHGFSESFRNDVAALFEHFLGKNPFERHETATFRSEHLKKGMRVKLHNGWEALIMASCKGSTVEAKVYGDFTEQGSIYANDIIAVYIDGKWVDIEF